MEDIGQKPSLTCLTALVSVFQFIGVDGRCLEDRCRWVADFGHPYGYGPPSSTRPDGPLGRVNDLGRPHRTEVADMEVEDVERVAPQWVGVQSSGEGDGLRVVAGLR